MGALPPAVLLQGVIVGGSFTGGTYLGKALVLRMSPGSFAHLLDGLMVVSGLSLIWAAWH